ncbi:hypothetical protein MRX96_003241 [Rhipicephalus microplus]|uniref:Uncharacterized protein n=1 Tax=Rhipicephalus microplus TaxID=6941 RepID=A0A9J6EHI0_RHIMP|nr:hypothetical protein HPB51_016225 [Rhipicephalus microplus]
MNLTTRHWLVMLGSQFSDLSPDERCMLLKAHSAGVVVYYDNSLGNDSFESSEEASSVVLGDKQRKLWRTCRRDSRTQTELNQRAAVDDRFYLSQHSEELFATEAASSKATLELLADGSKVLLQDFCVVLEPLKFTIELVLRAEMRRPEDVSDFSQAAVRQLRQMCPGFPHLKQQHLLEGIDAFPLLIA